MARRRGFFAEMQYQSQQAEKRRLAQERAEVRAHAQAAREWERARREAERAANAAARAADAERKAAAREAARLLAEARAAEVEERNTRLIDIDTELGLLLEGTLGVDDFVDLERLRAKAEHPPFPRPELENPVAPPKLIEARPAPAYVEPAAPTGVGAVFGGKKKHQAAIEEAKADFERAKAAWDAEAAAIPERQRKQLEDHQAQEDARLAELQSARDVYALECERREHEVAEANARLDAIIAGLPIGEPNAVNEYVGIVLGNSVYPDVLEVGHDYEFDPVTRELALTVLIAPPDRLPQEKAFRYVKSSDEITSTPLSGRALKDRYRGIVEQVALRSLHEIFEADRQGVVQTISLHVATETTDPATGRPRRIRFVGVGAARDAFEHLDLANVVPAATLKHLGAEVAKNPVDLDGLDDVTGVRRQ